jgi:hypothetical protein
MLHDFAHVLVECEVKPNMQGSIPGKWGSFFIEKSVDELLISEIADYDPPRCTIQLPSLAPVHQVTFGQEAISLFPLDREWYFL